MMEFWGGGDAPGSTPSASEIPWRTCFCARYCNLRRCICRRLNSRGNGQSIKMFLEDRWRGAYLLRAFSHGGSELVDRSCSAWHRGVLFLPQTPMKLKHGKERCTLKFCRRESIVLNHDLNAHRPPWHLRARRSRTLSQPLDNKARLPEQGAPTSLSPHHTTHSSLPVL